MKSVKFVKFPCRFQPEGEDDDDDDLGLPGKEDNYTVSDIWIDVHRVAAFSRHTSKNLTWATLDSGINLALEVHIAKFVAELSKYLDIEPMTQDTTADRPQYLLDHEEEDESLLNEEESAAINEILDDLDILPDDDTEEKGPDEEDLEKDN